MKAVLDAHSFKTMINNTKRFTGASEIMNYIYLEIDAEKKTIKATALNGWAVSVEHCYIKEADESFKCFIKPNIPKVTKHECYAELELVDKRLLVTIGENITGYIQPDGEFYNTEKFLSDATQTPANASIYVSADLLKDALSSCLTNNYDKAVKIEIRGKKQPIVIIPRKAKENVKLVLPIMCSEEGV